MSFKVDIEFKALIPQISPEEYAGLEASIAAEGVRDPLVVWSDLGILLDGHNRYEIAKRLGRPFNTTGLGFVTRDEAKAWIIRNQFSRRNLTPFQRAELALALEELLRLKAKERQKTHGGTAPGRPATLVQNSGHVIPTPQSGARTLVQNSGQVNNGKVDHQVARAARVSHDTVSRVRVVKQKAPEEVLAKLRTGQTTVNKVYSDIRREERRAEAQARVASDGAAAKVIPRVIQADCHDLFARCRPASVDLVLTEPPGRAEFKNDAEFTGFVNAWLRAAAARLKTTGRAYVCVGPHPVDILTYLAACRGLEDDGCIAGHEILVWTYRRAPDPAPTTVYTHNWMAVLHVSMPDAPVLNAPLASERLAAQYITAPEHAGIPIELAERFIRHATTAGAAVLDPFCGAGAFVLAAARLGRRAIGGDTSEEAIARAAASGCSHG